MYHPFSFQIKTHNVSHRTKIYFALAVFLSFFVGNNVFGQKAQKRVGQQREYIELKVYHAADANQLATIDQYLQSSFLPALEKNGFKRVGVFTAIDNDTAKDKRIYVLLPLASLSQLERLTSIADKTLDDSTLAPAYTKAAYNQAPFTHFETIILKAFEGAPQVKASAVKGNIDDRVYELRSYESATEAFHKNKVQMFNAGEVTLFDRLGFNAVFYGQVIAGGHMPNLMYMTSFETKAAREEHWKTFGNDPVWKTMSGKPEYQHNVSHIDITFLRPTAYSKL